MAAPAVETATAGAAAGAAGAGRSAARSRQDRLKLGQVYPRGANLDADLEILTNLEILKRILVRSS